MIQARNVVVAMADFQRPRVPAFAAELDRSLVQFHSSAYRNPNQLRPGAVLIVGLGNSGAEIARELVRAGHETYVSGTASGEMPFRIEGMLARLVLAPLLFRGVFFRLLRLDTPFGRKAYARVEGKATPLIRVKSRDLDADGVTRVPRMAGARDGLPLLVDRPAGVRFTRQADPHQGDLRRRAWALLRGTALPLRDVELDDPRGGARRGVSRGADRSALWGDSVGDGPEVRGGCGIAPPRGGQEHPSPFARCSR
jgi:hypothetical protein